MMKKGVLIALAVLFAAGCAGEATQLRMKDAVANEEKVIVFPNGTIFGGASRDQAAELARIFVESHNQSLQEMDEIEAAIDRALKNQDAMKEDMQQASRRSEEALQRIIASTEQISQRHTETAQQTIQMIEQLARKQGTGEITIFYPIGSAKIGKDSLEYERLVGFADYLSRESRGRKLVLISIGSASAVGDRKANLKLAKGRAEFPVDILDKYLVNVPHEFFKVYGTGDMYSPREASAQEHERYQHARIIAVYEADQMPGLPAEPSEAEK
ncbi:MAG: hypothetical protein AB1805_07785 [Nitrospirota bacterium]